MQVYAFPLEHPERLHSWVRRYWIHCHLVQSKYNEEKPSKTRKLRARSGSDARNPVVSRIRHAGRRQSKLYQSDFGLHSRVFSSKVTFEVTHGHKTCQVLFLQGTFLPWSTCPKRQLWLQHRNGSAKNMLGLKNWERTGQNDTNNIDSVQKQCFHTVCCRCQFWQRSLTQQRNQHPFRVSLLHLAVINGWN